MPANQSPPSIELEHIRKAREKDYGVISSEEDEGNDEQSKQTKDSTYIDVSTNDLGVIAGAALLSAECLGTGILALPSDVNELGLFWGVGFITFNLFVNFYAGYILSETARAVEQEEEDEVGASPGEEERLEAAKIEEFIDEDSACTENKDKNEHSHNSGAHHTSSTFDFIGISRAIYSSSSSYTPLVIMMIFYCNLFLVLGNYILVMSHAVAAFIGEDNICTAFAGLIASTLMFAFSQLRTMAKLGRSATIISLATLFFVVLQCIYFSNSSSLLQNQQNNNGNNRAADSTIMRKLAALSSIGFAVGSQKLFLNIRHEMKQRSMAPISLAICLAFFGSVYIVVCLMAGPNPPSFLFNAIPKDSNHRRIAGFFLWVHVAVSYAINTQAFCSSLDRCLFHRILFPSQNTLRWVLLTLATSVSSYGIANTIPFFRDLVSLIGASTSVPLTLLLPALLYRSKCSNAIDENSSSSSFTGIKRMQRFCRTNLGTLALIIFSLLFTICGLIGALFSIGSDWQHHPPKQQC